MIEVNPAQVTAIRQPRHDHGEHFAPGIRCLVFTADGKHVGVRESCREINDRLRK